MKIKGEDDFPSMPPIKKEKVKSETEKTLCKKVKLVVQKENKHVQKSKYLIGLNSLFND